MQCSNVERCSCPKTTCENYGKCCACVIKHRTTDSLPFCLFEDNGGDKSNKNHYEVLKKRFEIKSVKPQSKALTCPQKCPCKQAFLLLE